MKNTTQWMLLLAFFTLAACGSDNDNIEVPNEKFGITMAFKETGGDEPEYVVTQESVMQGTISAQGAGHEQLGWNFYYHVDKTLFVSGYENFETRSYKVDENGDVSQLATFFYDAPLEVFGNVDGHTLLASDQPRDGTHSKRKLYTVDASTGLITKKINYSIHDEDTGTPGEGTVAWAMALVVRGNELYIPFQKLDDQGLYTTPDADTAYVAIYDYPLASDAAPKKIISDTRTSNIGVNGATTGLIKTTNGDLYSFSSGALSAGFSPASTKPSGILRINNGESEFDLSYFFNIEEAAAGGKLFWFDYVGNGKAIARIIINEDGAYPWSAHSKDFFTQKLVIIDLEAKTVTDVQNVPLHQKRYTSPVTVIDGKVLVSIETADDAYVYQVDIATATATKGAEIAGKTVKGFFNLYP